MLYDENTTNLAFKTTDTKFSRINSIKSEHAYQNKSLEELENNDHFNNGNIALENISAKWIGGSTEETLNFIDIAFPSKKLSVVIGPVGGGKVSR